MAFNYLLSTVICARPITKVYILFLLIQHISGVEYAQSSDLQSNIGDDVHIKIDDIAMKWKNTDATLRKATAKFMNSLIPSAFEIITATNISESCNTGLVEFFKGMIENKHWAFRMLDSSGKMPNGIIGGSVVSLGDYDSCLDIDVINSFKGKYCLVNIKLPMPRRQMLAPVEQKIPEFSNIVHNESIIAALLNLGRYLYFMKPTTSICVPSTCTIDDIQNIASKALQLYEVNLGITIKDCVTKSEGFNFSDSDKILVSILGTLGLIVIVASIVDMYYKLKTQGSIEEEKLNNVLKYLLYFSVPRNGARLLTKDNNADSIKIFHGFRVLSSFWVILGHSYEIDHPEAYSNFYAGKGIPKQFGFQLIANGFLSVQTFFFMSGVLLAYFIMKAKDKELSIALIFIKRYVRTNIPQALVIACTCLLPHLASGPLYKEFIDQETFNCKYHGWRNLFFFQNYAPRSEMCIIPTWYLAADTQLFILGLFVLIPLKSKPKLIFMVLGFLLAFGITASVLSYIAYGLPPTLLRIYVQLEDLGYISDRGYFPTHFHLPTYCVGLAVGYVLATKKQISISKRVNIVGWIIALTVCFGVIFGIHIWNKSKEEAPGLLASILYGCFHRLLWSFSLAWITIVCHSKKEGIVYTFLSWEAFVPLGRLTFMAYLIHYNILRLHLSTIRQTITYDHRTIMIMFFSVTSTTFLVSCILTLIFESPFMSIVNNLMNRPTTREIEKGK